MAGSSPPKRGNPLPQGGTNIRGYSGRAESLGRSGGAELEGTSGDEGERTGPVETKVSQTGPAET